MMKIIFAKGIDKRQVIWYNIIVGRVLPKNQGFAFRKEISVSMLAFWTNRGEGI